MRILFIHGLASSGAYKLADMLRINLKADVKAPDVPIDPDEALELLCSLCKAEQPDLVVGLSWGGFLVHRIRHPWRSAPCCEQGRLLLAGVALNPQEARLEDRAWEPRSLGRGRSLWKEIPPFPTEGEVGVVGTLASLPWQETRLHS